jgi:hypothetical protein
MAGDPLAPIAGVSLEKYAELVVKTRAAGRDRKACAAIAEAHGVSRAAWECAMSGWEERLASDETPGSITVAYYKHYREALIRHMRMPVLATFDAYVEMSAMMRTETQSPERRPTGLALMCAAYRITPDKWAQISQYWSAKLAHDPALLATYSERVRAKVLDLDAAFLAKPH